MVHQAAAEVAVQCSAVQCSSASEFLRHTVRVHAVSCWSACIIQVGSLCVFLQLSAALCGTTTGVHVIFEGNNKQQQTTTTTKYQSVSTGGSSSSSGNDRVNDVLRSSCSIP
jgi:hypothetical protein